MKTPTTGVSRLATPSYHTRSDLHAAHAAGADVSSFVLTAITRDPGLAARADAAGVDRIGVDIERLGKQERQRHVAGARISDHELSDLAALGAVVKRASLFARLNPLHDRSQREVEGAIERRAAALTLPFFTCPSQVDSFVRLVDGRAAVVLLLETAPAVVRLRDILSVGGVDEVIVGLNDLCLATGVANPFELVVSDVMSMIADTVRAHGVRFGFGGLARAHDDELPVPSELVLAQHARLGSTSAWLARTFFKPDHDRIDVSAEVDALRARLAHWREQPAPVLASEQQRLRCHLKACSGH